MDRRGIRSIAVQKAIRTDMRAACWEMRIREGKAVAVIAEELGVSTTTVYGHLRAVLAEAKETLLTDIERWKIEEHHRYDHIYGEAMGAWERSKGDKVSRTVKAMKPRRKKAEDGWEETDITTRVIEDPDEIKERTDEMVGDPRFLTTALAALQDQGKLWGMNAPEVSRVDARVLEVRLEGAEGLDAIRAAEEAYRATKYLKAQVHDGDRSDLHTESGIVDATVSEVDEPAEGGQDTV